MREITLSSLIPAVSSRRVSDGRRQKERHIVFQATLFLASRCLWIKMELVLRNNNTGTTWKNHAMGREGKKDMYLGQWGGGSYFKGAYLKKKIPGRLQNQLIEIQCVLSLLPKNLSPNQTCRESGMISDFLSLVVGLKISVWIPLLQVTPRILSFCGLRMLVLNAC